MAALSVRKPLAYLILLLVYLLCLTMTTVCLAFAAEKRKAYIDNGIGSKSEMLEILYLFLIVATIVSVAVSMCCSLTSNEPNILGDGGAALVQFIIAILWIIIPAAYTVLTLNDDKQLSCSKSLAEKHLLYVCTERRNNFIFMWINSGIMLLSTFVLCFSFYGLEIKGEEDVIGIPLSTNNSEISTPPVLKRLNPYFCKN